MTTGQRLIDRASTKIGSRYVYGANGPTTFDCQGLTWWTCQQEKVSPALPHGSQYQYEHCKAFGLVIPKAVARNIPGSLFFRFGYGKNGHVVFCAGPIGHGGIVMTVEAKGTAYGVGSWPLVIGNFDAAGLIPGVDYSAATPPKPSPIEQGDEMAPFRRIDPVTHGVTVCNADGSVYAYDGPLGKGRYLGGVNAHPEWGVKSIVGFEFVPVPPYPYVVIGDIGDGRPHTYEFPADGSLVVH